MVIRHHNERTERGEPEELTHLVGQRAQAVVVQVQVAQADHVAHRRRQRAQPVVRQVQLHQVRQLQQCEFEELE